MKPVAAFFVISAFLAPGTAEACRRSPDPGAMMARHYASVAVVRIENVTPEDPARPADAWRASATRVSVVEGAEPPADLRLGHAEMPNCQERRPAPREGEYWVAYMEGIGEPDTVIHSAWPLDWARSLDPRFSQIPER
jgi:hypothetical protein